VAGAPQSTRLSGMPNLSRLQRAGGTRAVEQLRQIFAELHAVTVRDTVSFNDVLTQFGSDSWPRVQSFAKPPPIDA
jgi:NAD(P)H-dependent FMN reductase